MERAQLAFTWSQKRKSSVVPHAPQRKSTEAPRLVELPIVEKVQHGHSSGGAHAGCWRAAAAASSASELDSGTRFQVGASSLFRRQPFRFVPGPPNFTLSRQLTHTPQSCISRELASSLQAFAALPVVGVLKVGGFGSVSTLACGGIVAFARAAVGVASREVRLRITSDCHS
eukprot:4367046-Prymnesium_polylepis.2